MGALAVCYGIITPAMRFASGARAGGEFGRLHCGFLSEPGRKKEKREGLVGLAFSFELLMLLLSLSSWVALVHVCVC